MQLEKITVEVSKVSPYETDTKGNPKTEHAVIETFRGANNTKIIKLDTRYNGWTINDPKGGLMSVLGLANKVREIGNRPIEALSIDEYSSLTKLPVSAKVTMK